MTESAEMNPRVLAAAMSFHEDDDDESMGSFHFEAKENGSAGGGEGSGEESNHGERTSHDDEDEDDDFVPASLLSMIENAESAFTEMMADLNMGSPEPTEEKAKKPNKAAAADSAEFFSPRDSGYVSQAHHKDEGDVATESAVYGGWCKGVVGTF